MSDTPKIWIGSMHSPLLKVECNIPGRESFTVPVQGGYINKDESPIIITPNEEARFKDGKPQPIPIEFEIDLTHLGIPKGSLIAHATLKPR